MDHRRLEVGPRRIALRGEDMAVTLNGIAQGFAADRAAAVLRKLGIENALVDAGEIHPLGAKAGGEPWTAGIQHPRVGCSPFFGPLQMEVFLNGCQYLQYRN